MRGVRVAVVAEWYPSRADPVHGVWAHRQALAARDAGAEVRVLALRRPVPPLALARRGSTGALARWARAMRASLRPFELDGLTIEPVAFVAPPRPWSYATWGHWMAPSLARALARLRARWAPDLVHAHSLVPPGFAAACSRRGRAALAVSTHGPDVIHVAAGAIGRRACVTALRAADVVIANSEWARERCERLAGGPLTARVVHLGADVPGVLPARHERPTIVTVAHLQARKRHAVVLHALAEMPAQRRPDYVVIGDGAGREPLRRLAGELGLGEHVRFLGQLDHDAALAEAWRCHAMAMPSVEEPFGVAYVEAMAGGLPAIGAAGEGGPTDIAAAGEGMLLVPADDHRALARTLEHLLGDELHRAALGQAARRTVQEHFTWRTCGEHTVAAYEAAIARRGAR
jgi:glycosyltransferase involved in cell wall biosynthesis